jgi:hypothetical protein
VPGWLEAEPDIDLGGVRLLDEEGREVPYRLVDGRGPDGARWIELEPVNLRRGESGFSFALEVPEGELVDRLRLALEGDEGVLAATVMGGDPVGVLVREVRLGRLQGASVLELELPPSDLARLEVGLEELLPGLRPVGAALRRARPGRASDVPTFGYRLRPAPETDGRSRLLLSADGPPPRIEALELEVSGPAVFRRLVTVLDRSPDLPPGPARTLGSAELVRLPLGDGRPGLETTRVPVRPGSWPRLELVVERGAEAPLEVAAVRGVVAPRWIVFPRSGSGAARLSLANGEQPRTRTLERGPLGLDLPLAALAEVGPPVPAETTGGGDVDADASWVSLLFVLAAALLGWLAWRVFARP